MKCASCGGTLRYDVASYGLVCDFCGTIRRLHCPEEGTVVGEMDFASALRVSNTDWGVTRRLVTCNSCGARLLYDSDQMSGMCPFCGSAVVLTAEQANCGIAPGAIIPFSITKEEVAERFYKWNRFAFWAPERFRRGKLLEDLTPVYIPFWTFTADTVTTYSGRFGRTSGSGDSERTTWYQSTGIVEKHIDDFSICASRKFCSDKMLNSVAAFAAKDLIAYSPEMLSGMAAEIYTIGIDEAWETAKNGGLRKEIMDAPRQHEHADCYTDLRFSTEYSNVMFRYVLVPVWLSGCRFRGKIYNVVASGYNGRGNCNRPVSIAKLIGILVILALLAVLGRVIPYGFLIVSACIFVLFVAALIYIIMFFVTLSEQMRKDREKRSRQQ